MTEINGLPAHILLVHLIVVLVPLTAISLLLCAFWPAARRRLVWPTLLLATAALVMTPVTAEAGEWLEQRVADTPLVRTHTSLADGLLPWTIGLFALSALVAALHVRETRRRRRDALPSESIGGAAPGYPTRGGRGDILTESRSVAAPTQRSTFHRVIAVAVPLLAVALAIGSTVQVYRIGDSGAQAVWQNQFSSTPQDPGGGDVDQG